MRTFKKIVKYFLIAGACLGIYYYVVPKVQLDLADLITPPASTETPLEE